MASAPSQDAFASVITQVSPTGQPTRGPSRPVRPRQGSKKTPVGGAGSTTATGSSSRRAGTATNTTSTANPVKPAAAGNDDSKDATSSYELTEKPNTGTTTGTEGEKVPVATDTSDSTSPSSTSDPTAQHQEPRELDSTPTLQAPSEDTRPPSAAASTSSKKAGQTSTRPIDSVPANTAGPTTTAAAATNPTTTTPENISTSTANRQGISGTTGSGPSSSSAGALSPSPNASNKGKKKRKSWLSSLFASCTSGSSHQDDGEEEDEHGTKAAMAERAPGSANATRPATSKASSGARPVPGTTSTTADSLSKDMALVDLKSGSNDVNDNAAPAPTAVPAPTTTATGTSPTSPSHANAGLIGAGAVATAVVGGVAAAQSATATSHPSTTTPSDPNGSANDGTSTSPLPSSAANGNGQTSSAAPSLKAVDISPEIVAANSREGASLPRDETADVLSGAVQAPGSEGLTPTKKGSRRKSGGEASSTAMQTDTGDESRVSSVAGGGGGGGGGEDEAFEDSEEDEYMDEEQRIISQGGMGIPLDENGVPRPLLTELTPSDNGRKCLVLDLDETLVHSSFKLIHSPDFIVPVEIENQVHNVFVIKRPGVDAFMKRMGEIYEVVVFTASLSKYADPVLDQLDIHKVVKHRLFRESCYNHKGNYVKDLSQLGRPIGETIIIDNSPASYIFHPNNAVPVSSWFNDPHDTELTDLQHFLADLANVPDVRGVLDSGLYPSGSV